MPVTAELHDGTRLEFPDGTDPAVVQAAVKKVLAGRASSEAERKGRELPGAVRGLASVMQGPTFGFADEIAGGVGAAYRALTERPTMAGMITGQQPKSFGENYREIRDMARGAAKQESEDNPIFAAITRGAAAAPTMVLNPLRAIFAPATLTRGAGTLVGRMGQAAGTGAVFGAATGAGESTSSDASGVALDAAKGGAVSAALGAVASPAIDALGTVTRHGAAYFKPGAAESYAKQKVAEALARDAPSAATPSMVVGRTAAKLEALGPEARLVDAGGQNTRQLADTLATLPGKTKQATEEAIRLRQAGRADRMQGAAQSSLNPSGLRLSETVDDLVARRTEAAAPLYQELYKLSIQPSDSLRAAVAAADKLGAGAAAKRMATAARTPYSLAPDAPQMSMRDLDQLKQGLDDIIGGLKRSGNNKEAAAVLGLKADLVKELDGMTGGAYKAARDAFAGPSALIDAAEAGRVALAQDTANLAKSLRGMSEGEQEAFRIGAAEALREKLGSRSGQSQILELWREKGMQEKLREIFGSERTFREFAADVARERRLKGLESVGRGSQTAARQFGAGDLDVSAVASAAQTAGSLASGNVPGMLSGISNAWGRVKTPEPVRDRMGAMLLSQGQQGRMTLADIERQVNEVMNARIRRAAGIGVFGAQPANALADLVSR